MRPRICLIGQVVADVLFLKGAPIVRLGGVFHAARALSALGCEFEIAYVAPSYLDAEIAIHAHRLGSRQVLKIGEVEGCPNVLLVGEPTEAGPQGYEFILDKQHRCLLDLDAFKDQLRNKPFTDIMLFPGGFPLKEVLLALKSSTAAVHVDANFEPRNFQFFRVLDRPLRTLIVSTSSVTFLKDFKGDAGRISRAGLSAAERFILKENRGGSRYFCRGRKGHIKVPAFPRKITHSVGVGDCYNSVFAFLDHTHRPETSLRYASMISGDYACMLDESHFKAAAKRALLIPPKELAKLKGVSLPWEDRDKIHVYIAAPDFEAADVSKINSIVACLEYHNFVARRPVRENGEITRESGRQQRVETAEADIRLLEQCHMLLAIPIFDDPGTYFEMGFALRRGIPVIVYSPNPITENLLTEELPILVSSDRDEIITEIFKQAAKIYGR